MRRKKFFSEDKKKRQHKNSTQVELITVQEVNH